MTAGAIFVLGVVAADLLRIRRIHPAIVLGVPIALWIILYVAWLISRTGAWDRYWICALS